jgi:Glycosyl hydrolases family 31
MPFQALAAAATLLTVAPHGNRIELQLDRGAAEILWVSPATFRFRRVLDGVLPMIEWTDRDPVTVEREETPTHVRLRTRAIEVTIRKRGVLVGVHRSDGTALMQDLSEPESRTSGVTWERQTPPGSDFFGLGPRSDTAYSTLGKSLRAEIPFLVSTAGYGEYHNGAGTYRFDFTAADRYRIIGPEVDYYFYSGPVPKEIFEEHHATHAEPAPWMVSNERFGSWAGLKASLVRILQGAISAATTPVFDLSIYNTAPEELKTRARQLGSLVARVTPGTGKSGFRQQLDTFFGAYVAELQDRGFPVWHPLPFQFPNDRDAWRHIDEFMLGDEMLVAPMVDPGDKRTVYLPRGNWTNLETNEVISGPRTIAVESKSLPVWAKNGSIVPLDARNGMALHYFPKAGGEFFLLEGDIAEYSQAHAAPALDFLRLQIESKKDRDYQWVVHHSDKPTSVGFDDMNYREAAKLETLDDRTWFYDAANRNLHVRVKVKAGEDLIINVLQ